MGKTGHLYVVATPIGNYLDITMRAIEILKDIDGIICEEYRRGSTLMNKLGITSREIITLNEHNEETQAPRIVERMFSGEDFALISDCGTPVFSDPGYKLVEQAVACEIPVIPIPGPSSLSSALSILDFKMDKFIFSGFLPRNGEDRRKELIRLRNMDESIVIMDTPYRLKPLLEDVMKVFGRKRRITLAMDLTLPAEKILRGSVQDVINCVQIKKAEFILIIQH